VDRYIQITHVLPGRARFRLPWLREQASEAAGISEALQALPGVHEVEVHPFTGSVLCRHHPDRVDAAALVQELQRVTGALQVLARDEEPPPPPYLGTLRGMLAREVAAIFRDVDAAVLRSSHGAIDLGTIAAVGFGVASALKVASDRELPVPAWFNLAWWGLRTFLTFEKDAANDNAAAAPA
jgi:hypothetical protein